MFDDRKTDRSINYRLNEQGKEANNSSPQLGLIIHWLNGIYLDEWIVDEFLLIHTEKQVA